MKRDDIIKRKKLISRRSQPYSKVQSLIRERKVSILALMTLMIALLGLIMPHMTSTYKSAANLDIYGANYSSGHWDFDLRPGIVDRAFRSQWAFFDLDVRNIEEGFDFSNYSEIEFCIKGTDEELLLGFNIFNNILDKEFKIVQFSYPEMIAVGTNWKKVNIPFSKIGNPHWAINKPYPTFSRKRVFAIGFDLDANQFSSGDIWIDEIKLIDFNNTTTYLCDFSRMNTTFNGVDGIWHAGTGQR